MPQRESFTTNDVPAHGICILSLVVCQSRTDRSIDLCWANQTNKSFYKFIHVYWFFSLFIHNFTLMNLYLEGYFQDLWCKHRLHLQRSLMSMLQWLPLSTLRYGIDLCCLITFVKFMIPAWFIMINHIPLSWVSEFVLKPNDLKHFSNFRLLGSNFTLVH